MKISIKSFVVFLALAVVLFFAWYKFSYPRFVLVDLSVDKTQAVSIAESYLRSEGVNPEHYSTSVAFNYDRWADRYLQKTIGFNNRKDFIEKEGYDLFYWTVRFFKEFQKEEFDVKLSSKTGQIIGFRHQIEDIEPRADLGSDDSKRIAENFLKEHYQIDLGAYDIHKAEVKKYDARHDYIYSWEKSGVYIPWSNDEGGAKLITGVTISGKEVREFSVKGLEIPEKFQRYIQRQLLFGQHLSSFSFILLVIFLIFSVYTVVRKKHTVVVRSTKKLYIYIALVLAGLHLINTANNFQVILMDYDTSVSILSYLWLAISRSVIFIFIISILFIFPGLAGEALKNEDNSLNKSTSLYYYLKTTFLSRDVCASVMFGYLIFLIILGAQAVLFFLGQRYMGVWQEWNSLTRFSNAYIPFLSAFIIGISAGLNEEIAFRLFGINWVNRYVRSIPLAILVTSVFWGFGHASYPIFPVWFRGIEVTIIGLFLGFVYVRYGLLTVIIAHYLIDVFFGVSAYILGRSSFLLAASSVFVLAIPFIFALAAFIFNRNAEEKNIELALDKIQSYNLGILVTYISRKKHDGVSEARIKDELLENNWDSDIVEAGLRKVFGGK
ncbi:MAG: CPBP family intramembrane metalloprotease [Candidatus Omnitrophota bacterium]|jgi:membrane protease YdiL (CAAX protease family)|nr:MAG: CPBP family intramembrane metalloprotease [Candidatus Omnitrophota bacterium]